MNERGSAYKQAGVDLKAADSLTAKIKAMAAETYHKGVLRDIGLFGGMYKLDVQKTPNPVLVSATDGVGTKLKIAFELNRHESIGIDLVAMNVNDIVVHGARPLFFLDYISCSKLDVQQVEAIVSGIAEGCKKAECALLGGETAEMPGFYSPGDYDLSGFCVGVVDNDAIVDGSSIGVGNKVIGIASSGLHSNGYSLVRKLIQDQGLQLDSELPGSEVTLGEELLRPTRIYVRTVLNLLRDFEIKGIMHITGGGFYDNIPRILPKGVKIRIDGQSWTRPAVFEWIKASGGLSWEEMHQIFNCGIGMVLVVDKNQCEDILIRLQGLKEQSWLLGDVLQRKQDQEAVEIVF